ncbi:MAG: hypothetical protein RBT34_01700 [Anaerolineaceae bacterium]|jgi:hypothetical protein|nr:hypothetical protein [Anaerolineaceae bacterium]
MYIKEAQKEIRSSFLGGFVGQLVAGLIWALSAAVSTWAAPRLGMAILFFVSMLLFPLTQLILRLIGRPAKLSENNSLGQLATQIAFTVPIGFILVGAATLHQQSWFYPAAMIVVGAHYLPFIFLYGMPQFGVLAAVLILGGTGLGLYGPGIFSLGGWLGAAVLIAFAFVGRSVVLKEERLDTQ